MEFDPSEVRRINEVSGHGQGLQLRQGRDRVVETSGKWCRKYKFLKVVAIVK